MLLRLSELARRPGERALISAMTDLDFSPMRYSLELVVTLGEVSSACENITRDVVRLQSSHIQLKDGRFKHGTTPTSRMGDAWVMDRHVGAAHLSRCDVPVSMASEGTAATRAPVDERRPAATVGRRR